MTKNEIKRIQNLESRAWDRLGAYHAYLACIHADDIIGKRSYSLRWETDGTLSASESRTLMRIRAEWYGYDTVLGALKLPAVREGRNWQSISYAANRGQDPREHLAAMGLTTADLLDVWAG